MNKEKLIWFEYDITAHCNLNCASCSHFSPIAEKEFVSAEKAKKELSRFAEIANGKCKYIQIMGGEPLLNPDVEEILETTRNCFPIGEIRLVTNGILLASQPKSFWETCQKNQIDLYITKYPVQISISSIQTYATLFKVKLKWFRNGDLFLKYTLDPQANHDIENSFFNCIMRNCPQYHNGKLYHCSITGCVYKLNKAFGFHFKVDKEDFVDIFEEISIDDIYKFMSKPTQFCKYCNPIEWNKNKISWHISKCMPEEWITKNNF